MFSLFNMQNLVFELNYFSGEKNIEFFLLNAYTLVEL